MKRARKLPQFFKPILWSYDFYQLHPLKNKRIIIINTINYGDLKHWKWIKDYYGKRTINSVISKTRKAEIRPQAKHLARLII